MSRLRKKYFEEIVPALQSLYPEWNVMQIPALKKIVISMGVAEGAKDKTTLQEHINELALLSGQKPIIMRARKAISNFKLRKGQPIGLKVTASRKKDVDFLDRFIHVVCPRIRDFRGFASLKAMGWVIIV